MANKGGWARLVVIIVVLWVTAGACASSDPPAAESGALPEWETPALILFYTDN